MRTVPGSATVTTVLVTTLMAACGGGSGEVVRPAVTAASDLGPARSPAAVPPTPEPPAAPKATRAPVSTPEPVEVAYRIQTATSDPATASFANDVHAVLTDPRGWSRAGFVFVQRTNAPFRIVLAEGPRVDRLCRPMDTYTKYSCQNGPVVALNADRWRSATPQWTGDLASYRVMLINHEVGHLLHLHHPTVHCPAPGLPAPVMAQQSTELGACRPNPWPLQWEIDLAAQRREPLAPLPDHDASDHRPTPPAVDR